VPTSRRKPAKKKETEPRKRRSPEEARELILGACQKLLADRGPDAVGLKDVASQAGVSHALVTHYFGTIDALIDAAIEAYAGAQRAELIEHIVAHPDEGPRAWMKLYFEWINRPKTARLFGWALMSGRIQRDDFFSHRARGSRRIADAVEARLRAEGRDVDRDDLHFVMLLLNAAPHGYALGKQAFWASLGVDRVGPLEDAFFFDRLADTVELLVGARAPKRAKPARTRR
jgi:AcrR family transcriptional regulator